ncbi:MAG: hypothetical protein HC933_00065 [Pleurocapsa sp. SU_196_0]|nr:hypothetical protein [Pleurocapsa sp. SU_196_0]
MGDGSAVRSGLRSKARPLGQQIARGLKLATRAVHAPRVDCRHARHR